MSLVLFFFNMSAPTDSLTLLQCLTPKNEKESEAVMRQVETYAHAFKQDYKQYVPTETGWVLFDNLRLLKEITWHQYVLLYLSFHSERVYQASVKPVLDSKQMDVDQWSQIYFLLKTFMCIKGELGEDAETKAWSEKEDGKWITKSLYEELERMYDAKGYPANPRHLVWEIVSLFLGDKRLENGNKEEEEEEEESDVEEE